MSRVRSIQHRHRAARVRSKRAARPWAPRLQARVRLGSRKRRRRARSPRDDACDRRRRGVLL